MYITKSSLKQIIKEELQKLLYEDVGPGKRLGLGGYSTDVPRNVTYASAEKNRLVKQARQHRLDREEKQAKQHRFNREERELAWRRSRYPGDPVPEFPGAVMPSTEYGHLGQWQHDPISRAHEDAYQTAHTAWLDSGVGGFGPARSDTKEDLESQRATYEGPWTLAKTGPRA